MSNPTQPPYPQQPQPGYGYPPPGYAPPQPPKKSNAGKAIGLGCLGVVGLFVIIGIAAAATGGGSKTTTTSPAAQAPAAPGGSDSSGKAAAPPKPKPAAKAKTVLTEHGSGIKNTRKFTVDGDWDLTYTFDCSSFGFKGNMQVYEDYPSGSVLTNDLAIKGGDTTHQYGDGGTHWLKVNSECSWTVKVVDVP